MTRLVIKLDHDDRTIIPCGQCGRLVNVRGRPGLYVEGTRQGVCIACGGLHALGLATVLRRAALHERCVVAAAETDGARGGETSDQSGEAEGTARMAAQHAGMIDEPLAALRALEQELLQRGRSSL